MTNGITALEPDGFWKYFSKISEIPRESCHEEKLIGYLEEVAMSKGMDYSRDDTGNIVIRVEASRGYENSSGLILQSHSDMVCVKDPEIEHDFSRDGIKLKIQDEWVTADGTSLGADNGVGIAASLAILDEIDLIHPALEILVTVEEEVGLTGAINLAEDMINGRVMINLDAGEVSKPCIGSAGGCDTVMKIAAPRESISNGLPVKLKVSGLTSAHSGDMYNKRANALKLLAIVLLHALHFDIRIAHLNGGKRRNVIPSEAEAILHIPADKIARFEDFVKTQEDLAREEYRVSDPCLKFEILTDIEQIDSVIERNAVEKILRFLIALPNGLLAVNMDFEKLPVKSSNLAVVETHSEFVKFLSLSRGNSAYALEEILSSVKAAGELAGAEITTENPYTAWEINPGSRILELAKRIHMQMFSTEAVPMASHGGLETGIISSKFPDLDIVCISALVKDAHTTRERLSIESVKEFYMFLKSLITGVATEY